MVGTKLFRNAGASSNGAVAVKLQVDGKFLVFTISAEDSKLVKSEPDNPGREIVMNPTETAQTKCFPCDVDNCACGGSLKVKVQRVKRNYGRKRYWIWRIDYPGGGHMEAMRIMDSALPLGAWLFLYTALPEGINPKKFEGLCSATPCDTLYIEPCGEFDTGVQYGGNVIASHPAATGAWDCSHKCWDVGRFQDRPGPVYFSYDAGANVCSYASPPPGGPLPGGGGMLLGGLSTSDVNIADPSWDRRKAESVVSDGGAMTGSVQVVSPVWTLAQ